MCTYLESLSVIAFNLLLLKVFLTRPPQDGKYTLCTQSEAHRLKSQYNRSQCRNKLSATQSIRSSTMLLRTVWGSLILFVAHANERESEYSEGQRHFPSIPDFPPDSSSNLVLLTHERSYREKVLMVSDLVGNPLGQDEGSSSFLAYSNDDANARIPQDLDGTHFEGDIAGVSLAAVDMLSLGKNENESTVKNAITNTYQRWPGGEIPYVISNSFSRRDRKVIRRAVDQFQAQSCVSWRPRRPSDQNYVHILRDKGCYSSVGRKYGRGGQVLSLGDILMVTNYSTVDIWFLKLQLDSVKSRVLQDFPAD